MSYGKATELRISMVGYVVVDEYGNIIGQYNPVLGENTIEVFTSFEDAEKVAEHYEKELGRHHSVRKVRLIQIPVWRD